ncbi:MAG: hypothetical protein CMF48_06960 [Legionellales bacterium]|nr:hypothetical protein [Legionellales bacterium]
MIKLLDLLRECELLDVNVHQLEDNPEISGVAGCIQDVAPGALFVADFSECTDMTQVTRFLEGAEYLQEAIDMGAAALIVRPDCQKHVQALISAAHIPVIEHTSPLSILGPLAAVYTAFEKPQYRGAVTGTNGKTSSVNFASQLCHLLGVKSSSIGTLGILDGKGQHLEEITSGLSIPETVRFQKILKKLKNDGVQAVFTEAPSHGLHQYRLNGLSPQVGAFTNFMEDHLDLHGTMESYFNTKMRLFTQTMHTPGTTILNADMDTEYFDRAKQICLSMGHKVVEFGYKGQDLTITDVENKQNLLTAHFTWDGVDYSFKVPLIGYYNIHNVFTGLLMVDSLLDVERPKLIAALNKLKPVQGRMEQVARHPNGGNIYIDFAHNADGMQNMLKSLKEAGFSNVSVVFGCNGGRHPDIAPSLGIASTWADKVIITDALPMGDDPDFIRKQLVVAAKKSHKNVCEIPCRYEAIKHAISTIESNETLIICGLVIKKWPVGGQGGELIDDYAAIKRILNTEE